PRRLDRHHGARTLDDDDGIRHRGAGGCGVRRRDDGRRGALHADAHVAHGDFGFGEAQLVEQLAEPAHELRGVRGSVARAPADRHQPATATRPRYSPLRVSTFTTSPSLRKSGTCTTAPVSGVAGLLPPCAVSPRTPGSVFAIESSTKFGSSTVAGEPSM